MLNYNAELFLLYRYTNKQTYTKVPKFYRLHLDNFKLNLNIIVKEGQATDY